MTNRFDAAATHRDTELARLTRADSEVRAALTRVLSAVRLLERKSCSGVLAADAAQRLRALRSRESQLHSDLAAGTAALRIVRAAPATPAVAPRS